MTKDADGSVWASAQMRLEDRWTRMRRDGAAPVVRQDASRARDALRAYSWGRAHRMAPNAVPVFVVGIQRSGTDMVIDSLRRSPEVEVHNESARSRAFVDYQLRDDETIGRLVRASRHRAIVFKALCDSDRVLHLLEGLGVPSRGRAIWVVRSMEGRVRSTLARWPENNRRVLRRIAAGEGAACWEARGLSQESLELVRSVDYERMSQASAAALLWLVRNLLFFELGLHERPDVALVRYENVLEQPEPSIRAVAGFLDIEFSPRMAAHIAARPPATPGDLEIDPGIRERCSELEARFTRTVEGRAPRVATVSQ
jgi:hypothetical protein